MYDSANDVLGTFVDRRRVQYATEDALPLAASMLKANLEVIFFSGSCQIHLTSATKASKRGKISVVFFVPPKSLYISSKL